MMTAVAISGSPSHQSKSRRLVRHALDRAQFTAGVLDDFLAARVESAVGEALALTAQLLSLTR